MFIGLLSYGFDNIMHILNIGPLSDVISNFFFILSTVFCRTEILNTDKVQINGQFLLLWTIIGVSENSA